MRPCDATLAARRIKTGNTTVQARLDEMMALQYEAEEIITSVRNQERRMYDSHRTKPEWFDAIGPGCKVLIEARHMSMPIKAYSKPKWSSKYYGPYVVKAVVDRTVIEVELPPGSRIHPRFDISRVKPFYERSMLWIPPDGDTTKAWSPDMASWHPPYQLPDWLHHPTESLPEIPVGDDYEVKTILAHREDRDGIRYLVQWSNYQIEDSTWVHADECGDAQEKIQDYHDRVLRMTTYNAHGDTSTLDYMQLASIVQPRTDDYFYQTQKADDYAQHCGSTAPQSVLSSVGGSWARSTPYPRQEPETQLDDSEMIYSQHPSTGQPSGCQYSSEVRTNQRTPDTTDTS
jgi:hypothetical protein